LQRQPIHEPLFTGVKAVDAAIPIGRGQRELILGDRETGKTSLALDAIINQRDSGVVCIYVSIGRKRASVVEVVEELRRYDALTHTSVVVADASEAAALRYLAPYAGCTLAEWFAYRGRHALIVYDDLTRHAEAYRNLSLILRRPPGREAYPGDIFSIHARLMERAFKLSQSLGGGSVTALPIVETQRGNIAGFIPTNLISMTDGQLYLDTALFAQGQLPAIDIGKSVSRVGGDAQPGAMRDAAAELRLAIAQYEEVKGFARFGAILDEATKRQIARGERLVRILTQPERHVIPLPVQVVELWALKTGLLDDVEPSALPTFEQGVLATRSEFGHLEPQMRSAHAIDAATAHSLRQWVARAKPPH
jgi:F-type H+-transporting ATPase subunit alpha